MTLATRTGASAWRFAGRFPQHRAHAPVGSPTFAAAPSRSRGTWTARRFEVRLPPPRLGEHTQALLRDVGYPSEQVERWHYRRLRSGIGRDIEGSFVCNELAPRSDQL